MITDFFLYLIYLAIKICLSPFLLLPIATIPNFVSQPFSTIMPYLMIFDVVLPITTLIALLGLTLTFEGGYFMFKSLYWVLRRIPTQS